MKSKSDPIDDNEKRFFMLVAEFSLKKSGGSPTDWDAAILDAQYQGASHGEKCTIQFLVNLWDPNFQWRCGTFDFFEAWNVWDKSHKKVFLEWVKSPFWP